MKNIINSSENNTNKKQAKISIIGLIKATSTVVTLVIGIAAYKSIDAHKNGEVVSFSKEIHPSADHVFKLIQPLHFHLNDGTIDFVNLRDLSDTIPAKTPHSNYQEDIFHSFIQERKPFENFNSELSNHKEMIVQLKIFMQNHASILKDQYGITDIHNLSPQKLIVLAQYITQSIVEYGTYFEQLDATSRSNGSWDGIIAQSKLHSWENVGNGLIGVDIILKKINEKKVQTNGICHNYSAIFQTIVDILRKIQKSEYIRNNISCTSSTTSGSLIEDTIFDIKKHVWNTCYYHLSRDLLQATIIDVTHTDSTAFKFDAYMDYTGDRFLNEVWRYYEVNPLNTLDGIKEISYQLEKDRNNIGKNTFTYRKYTQMINTLEAIIKKSQQNK